MLILLFAGTSLGADHLSKCEGSQGQVSTCDLPPCSNDVCTDCTFADWQEWEPCTCEGLQERRRSIATKNNACGKPCEGTLVDTRNCSPNCVAKPHDCELSEWTTWTACDKECDGGQQYRERHVAQASNHMGKPCDGRLEETKFCNMDACIAMKPCVFAEWSQWSDCSDGCATGRKKRSRAIASHAGHGGKPCEGALEEYARCTGNDCDQTADCVWGEWVSWSTCTKICGAGTKSRTRHIAKAPESGGRLCDPKITSEVVVCNEGPCNGEEQTDCVFDAWSEWDACSCSINGISHRVRHVNVYASHGGEPCTGAAREITSCNTDQTVEPSATTPEPASVAEVSPTGPPVDCKIGEWGSWSTCNKECGPGSQVRMRNVERYPSHKGAECSGSLEDMQGCEKAPCAVAKDADEPCDHPTDFEFGTWDEWGICSVSCAGGERTRSRRIMQNANMYGKAAELAATLEVEPCNMRGCNCRDCAWGMWSDWGACTCTGLKERHREIHSHADSCGSPCQGARVETAACHPDCSEPVLDCDFDNWAEWSKCTATCGGGQRERKRDINAEASIGGRVCIGALREAEACNAQGCFQATPCTLGDWAEWSLCSRQCGSGGQQTRVRDILNEAEHNGQGCAAPLKELRGCTGTSCGGSVDCVWGEWGNYGPCSASCGGGHKLRDRTITQSPRADGELCENRTKAEVAACNTSPCAASECANGQWGQWESWSQCSASCGQSYRVRNRAIAVTASSCGHPAEGQASEYEKCPPRLCNEEAVDCVLAMWSEWGVCSCTCNGVKERTRGIATYSAYGGRNCNGSLKEASGCNVDSCNVAEPLDCVLAPWGGWDKCSEPCNGGIQYRARSIAQYPKAFGKSCQGVLRHVRPCNRHSCTSAVDCEWGEWSKWGVCSKECDGGQRHRYRHISKMPNHNGMPCDPRNSSVIEACNEQDCVGVMKYCGFGQWSSWTSCSATCGDGKKTRTRQLDVFNSKPSNKEDILAVGMLDEIDSQELYQPSNEKLAGVFAAGSMVSLLIYASFLQVQRSYSTPRRTTFNEESELQLLGSENQPL